MALNKLSYELFPDVKYDGESYSADLEGKLSPLSVLFKSKFLGKDKFKLLILGAASLGKSSMLKTLRLDLLDWGVPFFSYDLKDLNNSAFALDGFQKEIGRLLKSMLVILDGYDELYDEQVLSVVDKLIFNTENPIIVASRHGNTVKRKSVVNDNITDERRREDPNEDIELFGEYEQAQIDQLSDERVNEILNRNDIIVNRSVRELLRTTMFMSMLLTLDKSRPMEWGDIDNETEFMSLYFSELFKEKNTGNNSASKVLYDIGKEIYLISAKNALRFEKSELPQIPTELNSIYYEKSNGYKWGIESDQIRFLNYAVSVYLCREIKDLYDGNRICDFTVAGLLEYILNKDTLIGAGRLIKKLPNGVEIIRQFNNRCSKEASRTYFNIVCIFTGYNSGILNDIDKNKIFDLGKCVRKTTEKFHFFTNNSGLIEINSKYFTKIKSYGAGCRFKLTLGDWVKSVPARAFCNVGLCIAEIFIGKNVKRIGHRAFSSHGISCISVDNENKFFYEKAGCLIDIKRNSVVLGIYGAEIPDGIISISDGALPRSGIFRIPDSVQYIGRQGDISFRAAFLCIDKRGRYILCSQLCTHWGVDIYSSEYTQGGRDVSLVKKRSNSICGIDINTMDQNTQKAFKCIQRMYSFIIGLLSDGIIGYIFYLLSIYINAIRSHRHVKTYYPSLRNWYYFKKLRALMLLQKWLFDCEQDTVITIC